MVLLDDTPHRRPRMARVSKTSHVSHALARIRREPIGDLPLAGRLDQLLREGGHTWGCATSHAGVFGIECELGANRRSGGSYARPDDTPGSSPADHEVVHGLAGPDHSA